MINKSISLMIVESQPLMCAALGTTFSSEGMNVLAEIIDSRYVIQTAKQLTPDLILYSVGMPSLNDLERISTLKKELPATQIVALITGEFSGQYKVAKEYGANLVLSKVLSRSEILASVKSLLEQTSSINLQTN